MIKKFNQFINENIALSNSSAKINIDDDEAEMFTTDPVLQKLISDQKVSLLTPELWFESEDTETINILKDYFDIDWSRILDDDEDSFVDEEDVEEDGFDEENESVTNEEISLKGLGLGALMSLAVSCVGPSIKDANGNEFPEEKVSQYVGDAVVKNIHLSSGKSQYYTIVSVDSVGDRIYFHTHDLTFNVGDTIHIDMSKDIAYPKGSSEEEDRKYTESSIMKFENYKEKMKDKVEKAKNRDKNPTVKTEGKPDSYKEKMKAKVAKAKETLKPRK